MQGSFREPILCEPEAERKPETQLDSVLPPPVSPVLGGGVTKAKPVAAHGDRVGSLPRGGGGGGAGKQPQGGLLYLSVK